jgi:predicted PurR-regulated permease PerM
MGGLVLFGINGLILGPLIIVLFLTVLEMFFKEHHIKKRKINIEENKDNE